jgi:hypothetical protein
MILSYSFANLTRTIYFAARATVTGWGMVWVEGRGYSSVLMGLRTDGGFLVPRLRYWNDSSAIFTPFLPISGTSVDYFARCETVIAWARGT